MFELVVDTSEPLPGLQPIVTDRAPDLRVELGTLPLQADTAAAPWYVSPFHDVWHRTVLTAWLTGDDRAFHLKYAEGPEFLVARDGTSVSAAWPSSITLPIVTSYLLSPILAFVLRLRHTVCLHASGVAIDGRAVLFMGPSRSGKSRIAAWLAAKGHAVLADDVVALDACDGRFSARPSFPWLRLHDSSRSDVDAYLRPRPKLASNWDFDYLDLELGQTGFAFQNTPRPVGLMYFVESDEASGRPDAGPIEIDGLPASQSVVNLLSRTWGSRMIDDGLRAEEFALLADLAGTVNMRRLRWSGRSRDLEAVCERIREDLT